MLAYKLRNYGKASEFRTSLEVFKTKKQINSVGLFIADFNIFLIFNFSKMLNAYICNIV